MEENKRYIIHVDMDNTLVDFKSALNKVSIDTLTRYEGEEDNIPGIFSLMNPMPKAVETFKKLSEKHDVYILSTAPWNNPSAWSDKLNWVKKYLGNSAYKRLTLSHNKNLVKGDFLIDDRDANGAKDFEGIHLKFGSTKFPNWGSILEYFIIS
jgi:5'-nucleotidase